MSAKKFAQAVKGEAHIYVLTYTPAPVTRRLAAVLTTKTNPIPEKYRDFAEMFSLEAAGLLPDYNAMEYRIDFKPSSQLLYGPIYALSKKELEVLYKYLDTSISKGWIRCFTSPARTPIMFVSKKGRSLCLCVDY